MQFQSTESPAVPGLLVNAESQAPMPTELHPARTEFDSDLSHPAAEVSSPPGLTGAGTSQVIVAALHSGHDQLPRPRWEAGYLRLWLGTRLLKEFRGRAPYQRCLLAAFEEAGWTDEWIDDPLPLDAGEDEEDGKQRLRNTLDNLNRSLPSGSIRFHSDGSGQKVRWGRQRRHRQKLQSGKEKGREH